MNLLERLRRLARLSESGKIVGYGRYEVQCVDVEGRPVWDRRISNIVPTEGLNKLLTEALKGSGYTAAWYVGLVDNSPAPTYALGDTLASHAGWTEFTTYTGSRKAITFGTAAAGVLASSSVATHAITGSGTLDGMFVCDAASGTSGSLLSAGAFSAGDAPVASGYVLTTSFSLTLANP